MILRLLLAIAAAIFAIPASAAHPCGPKRVALTFDDAPIPDSAIMTGWERTGRIMAALAGARVEEVAFFSLSERAVGEGRQRLLAYAQAGHIIANHSQSHANLHAVGAATFLEDVRAAHGVLSHLPGFQALFRFPMLNEGESVEQRDAVRIGLDELGYRQGYVTIDTYDFYIDNLLRRAVARGDEVDWDALGKLYVGSVLGAAEHYDSLACEWLDRSPAHVLLLHENDLAALYLDKLITALRRNGWTIISPIDAYSDPIARIVPDTLVLGQGRVAALAYLAGAPRSALRHASENTGYLDRRFQEIGFPVPNEFNSGYRSFGNRGAATLSSMGAKEAIARAAGYMLQGEAKRALSVLYSVPEDEFQDDERRLRDCILARFDGSADGSLPGNLSTLAARSLELYRSYWSAALLEPDSKTVEEERLRRRLGDLLGLQDNVSADEIDRHLKKRLEEQGLHALTGRTPPLPEMILWSSETAETRQVQLPEASYDVKVKVLDDFASLGWSAFATCNRSFTGGWVGKDAIYAVRPGWSDLTAENFNISFIAHEAQHFWDKARFPEISSATLEYRGKLTELALAKTTLVRLLRTFHSNQGDDPAIPHSQANRRILRDLRSQLEVDAGFDLASVSVEAINEAARQLLLEDSARRALAQP